jgi:MoaA/NifB/PqqE/SkfB family radical SAM enzyme
MKFLINQLNRDELSESVKFAIDKEFDSIQFKALRLHPQQLTPEQEEEVESEIEKLRKEYAPFLVIGGVKKYNILHKCELTPLQTTIDACGDVFLCCYYSHRAQKHKIGNIYESSFVDIWYSRKHLEAIDGIDPEECNVFDCRFIKYHDVVERWIGRDEGQFQFI